MVGAVKQPLSVQLWSAAPTPLTAELKVDEASLERMIEGAVTDGLTGLFLAGTCGEGPWLPNRERRRLVQSAVTMACGRLRIAAQVSDNSAARILDNIADMAAAGADCAMISHPTSMMNVTPERVFALFADATAASPLPVGIYDWGTRRPFCIPEERLKQVYLLPNVSLVKDSSTSPERRAIALAARKEKPSLVLLNGDEFRCIEYLAAGYNGCMFGGAIAVAPYMRQIAELLAAGQRAEAAEVERAMKNVLYGIYGGESIACWLTGLKHYLVCKGLFASSASFLGYPLTEACRGFIERHAAEGALVNG